MYIVLAVYFPNKLSKLRQIIKGDKIAKVGIDMSDQNAASSVNIIEMQNQGDLNKEENKSLKENVDQGHGNVNECVTEMCNLKNSNDKNIKEEFNVDDPKSHIEDYEKENIDNASKQEEQEDLNAEQNNVGEEIGDKIMNDNHLRNEDEVHEPQKAHGANEDHEITNDVKTII